MSAIVNGEGGVIINGVSGGGGGAGLPTATGADQVPVSTGAGTTYVATDATTVVANVLDAFLGSQPAGTALISDGAGAATGTSVSVAALLAATRLVFDEVVNVATHTTNNNNAHQLLTIACDTNDRAYTFRGTISAARDDYSNAYAWDVVATLSNNGSLELRTSLITPTDPTAPYTVAVSRSGNQLHVDVTGATGHNVQWHGGGFLTVYGA